MDEKTLSHRRKELQKNGEAPDWLTTAGYQMLVSNYLIEGETPKQRFTVIAETLAQYVEGKMPVYAPYQTWQDAFFSELWNGYTSASTPVLSNTGTNKGMSVSCSGGYIPDSVDGFYTALHEAALLSKHGFGTSAYLGDIRPRGATFDGIGKASGVLPVIQMFVEMSKTVSQGSQRRGAWAGYLPIDHGDFYEVATYLENNPDSLNLGWCFSDDFIDKLNDGDSDAIDRFQTALRVKMITGKGYWVKNDVANKSMPRHYSQNGLTFKASNLCTEIILPSNEEYTFTCVLASKNLDKYDKWKNTNSVKISTVMLDCVCQDFIEKAKDINGLEKAVKFTEDFRAVGLGVLGFHTLLQQRMIPFESLEASYLNNEIFKYIREEADAATIDLATYLGKAPCANKKVRNCSLLAVAPTKSTSLILGGISEGINPDPAMTFTQTTPVGEVERINPTLLKLMKSKGINTKEHIQEVIDAKGSVQHVSWLTEEEKAVFKTAFEINQHVVVRLAANRQRYIDQAQSMNLFFAGDDDESYIAEIHSAVLNNPNIISAYYCYSRREASGSSDKNICLTCQ